MKHGAAHLILTVCLFAGLTTFPVLADLGLQQIFSGEPVVEEGLTKVGLTVKAAVEAIYGSTEDKEQILSQITAVLDEAALTGNSDIVSYTIVAVMLAGGSDNLDLSKEAIDNSKAFIDFPTVTALTVSAAEVLLADATDSSAVGGAGSDSGGGGEEGGGGDSKELGGGDDGNPLDDGGDANIRDDDVPGTPV